MSKLTEERTFLVESESKTHWLVRPDSDEFDTWFHKGFHDYYWNKPFNPSSYDKIVLPAEYLT